MPIFLERAKIQKMFFVVPHKKQDIRNEFSSVEVKYLRKRT